jgi:hypothetical protein
MLGFANIALEFLLEFGMHCPCLLLVIDKCCLLIRYKLLFYEFALEYEKKLLLLFDCILYILYYI